MTRARETWSCHDKRHPEAPGSPFGATHGAPLRMSCFRCGMHMPSAQLQPEKRVPFQKRCIDREACATAQGGGS